MAKTKKVSHVSLYQLNLGQSLDDLNELSSLLECQRDALLGLNNRYSSEAHHYALNIIILDKLRQIINTLFKIQKVIRPKV